MKSSYLLYLLIPVGLSCTSSYKSLQTPDDVYYSPGFYRTGHSKTDSNYTENSRANNSTVTISNSTYHDYDDAYYYRRRRSYYYENDDYTGYKNSGKTVVTKARTSNLNAYNPHKPTPVNPKLSGVPVNNPTNTTDNSGHAVRTFKRSGNSVVGNVVRAIVNGGAQFNNRSSNNNSNTDNNKRSTNSSSSSGSTSKPSTPASVRSFEKKN